MKGGLKLMPRMPFYKKKTFICLLRRPFSEIGVKFEKEIKYFVARLVKELFIYIFFLS